MLFCFCSVDDVEGIESLRWEDQQRIRNYVEAGGPSNTKAVSPKAMKYAIEVSRTSRATCKQCSQKIMEEEVDFYFIHYGACLQLLCCFLSFRYF